MVVKRRPQIKTVEEFIGAGGTVAQEQDAAPQPSGSPIEPASHNDSDEEIKSLKMRLHVSLLKQIDEAVAQRRPAPSRHQWILEAIWEKLERGEPD
jgi:hypothetical protein